MTTRLLKTAVRLVALWMCVGLAAQSMLLQAQNPAAKKIPMTSHAKGTFDVKITPQPPSQGDEPGLGRLLVEKQYHGDIEGTSRGEMITAGSGQTSGGYVLLERVTGTFAGRRGTFFLQHSGIMDAGKPQLNIVVVPGSGTGELKGLRGKFNLDIRDGKHYYDIEYALEPDGK